MRRIATILFVYYSANNKYSLYAAAENEFYSRAEFLNIHFKMENSSVSGFQIDRYGGNQEFKKVK